MGVYHACNPDLPALQSSLFNNILLALKIDKTNKSVLTSLGDIEGKVIIAMGEAAAQQLLNSTESIELLRGKRHTFENIPLIVTYHLHDMLQNLATHCLHPYPSRSYPLAQTAAACG